MLPQKIRSFPPSFLINQNCMRDSTTREALLKGKTQYGWFPSFDQLIFRCYLFLPSLSSIISFSFFCFYHWIQLCQSIYFSPSPSASSSGWTRTLYLRMTRQVFYHSATAICQPFQDFDLGQPYLKISTFLANFWQIFGEFLANFWWIFGGKFWLNGIFGLLLASVLGRFFGRNNFCYWWK